MLHSKLMTENMRMAIETIRTHKIRSLLTVLGVVIGVAVAIVTASILLGLEQNVQDSFNEFGVNNLLVFRFNIGIHFSRLSPEERMRKPLTFEDGMAMKEELPDVKDVAIEVMPRQGQGPGVIRTARHKGHELSSIDFDGATASYAEVNAFPMKEGRFFTDIEDLHR